MKYYRLALPPLHHTLTSAATSPPPPPDDTMVATTTVFAAVIAILAAAATTILAAAIVLASEDGSDKTDKTDKPVKTAKTVVLTPVNRAAADAAANSAAMSLAICAIWRVAYFASIIVVNIYLFTGAAISENFVGIAVVIIVFSKFGPSMLGARADTPIVKE